MQAILFYVDPTAYSQDLSVFIRRAGDLKIPSGVQRLAPTVWLIDLPDDGAFQQQLTTLAIQRGLTPRSLAIAYEAEGSIPP